MDVLRKENNNKYGFSLAYEPSLKCCLKKEKEKETPEEWKQIANVWQPFATI